MFMKEIYHEVGKYVELAQDRIKLQGFCGSVVELFCFFYFTVGRSLGQSVSFYSKPHFI
jgi:hypothetical protein